MSSSLHHITCRNVLTMVSRRRNIYSSSASVPLIATKTITPPPYHHDAPPLTLPRRHINTTIPTSNKITSPISLTNGKEQQKQNQKHRRSTFASLTTTATTPTSSPIYAGLVPVVLESGTTGERSFDIYSRLLRERIICVHGEVTDTMASLVTAQLLFLEAEAPTKPLYMYINSPGGLVTAGMAIYDTMQYIAPEVHTICMGQAASMGSLLLAGGSAGCRFSLPNARIMLHQPRGGSQGTAADIDIAAKEILRTRENLNRLYGFHTGRSLDVIERVMDRDTFMSPTQALEFGVIDGVLDKRGGEADEGGGEDEGDNKEGDE